MKIDIDNSKNNLKRHFKANIQAFSFELTIKYFFLLDENGNGTESTTCDDTTKEVNISNGTNNEATSDENKDTNTNFEISVTKQLVEEETVMNTAVED